MGLLPVEAELGLTVAFHHFQRGAAAALRGDGEDIFHHRICEAALAEGLYDKIAFEGGVIRRRDMLQDAAAANGEMRADRIDARRAGGEDGFDLAVGREAQVIAGRCEGDEAPVCGHAVAGVTQI